MDQLSATLDTLRGEVGAQATRAGAASDHTARLQTDLTAANAQVGCYKCKLSVGSGIEYVLFDQSGLSISHATDRLAEGPTGSRSLSK